MQHITIDGVLYRVRISYPSMSRSFSIVEGQNGGTAITARSIRDIKGTSYLYEMQVEPDPRYPEDYDAFYEVISAPVESHMVELPYHVKGKAMDFCVRGVPGAKLLSYVKTLPVHYAYQIGNSDFVHMDVT